MSAPTERCALIFSAICPTPPEPLPDTARAAIGAIGAVPPDSRLPWGSWLDCQHYLETQVSPEAASQVSAALEPLAKGGLGGELNRPLAVARRLIASLGTRTVEVIACNDPQSLLAALGVAYALAGEASCTVMLDVLDVAADHAPRAATTHALSFTAPVLDARALESLGVCLRKVLWTEEAGPPRWWHLDRITAPVWAQGPLDQVWDEICADAQDGFVRGWRGLPPAPKALSEQATSPDSGSDAVFNDPDVPDDGDDT